MIIKSALSQAAKQLEKTSDAPQLDAEVLLSHALNKTKEWVLAHPEYEPKIREAKLFKSFILRRSKHEPVAYITGRKEFYGLDFYVARHVLIPRPETEELVERVLQEVGSKKYELIIADIGTGSGCIAITLAKHLPQAKIYAIDISKKALRVARKNARIHSVEKQITFLQGNLLEPLPEKVDIIVANLPYLSEKVYKKTSPSIKKYEPKMALVAPEKGMYYYKRLLKQAPKYMKTGGKIFLELGPKISIKKMPF